MNAILVPTRVGVPSVVVRGFPMRTTVKSAPYRKKTGMDVQRLLTWDLPEQTCFMNERNMGLSRKRGFNVEMSHL